MVSVRGFVGGFGGGATIAKESGTIEGGTRNKRRRKKRRGMDLDPQEYDNLVRINKHAHSPPPFFFFLRVFFSCFASLDIVDYVWIRDSCKEEFPI